jgi:transposase
MRKELTDAQRKEIIEGYERGDSYKVIAKNVKCGKTTVYDTVKRFARTGSATPRKRRGRKSFFDLKLTTLKDLVTQNAISRRSTISEIQATWNTIYKEDISVYTIRRALRKVGLRSCIARRKPLISEKNKKKRLQWALEHQDWTIQDWKCVVWTDESTFTQFQDQTLRVWRLPSEEFNLLCISPTVKHSPSRMFWGCFSWYGLGPIVPLQDSVTGVHYAEILKKYAIPSCSKLVPNNDGILQEDNAPPHRAKVAEVVRDSAGIQVLDWPAQSPDLNLIENLWQEIKFKLRSDPNKPTSLSDLESKVEVAWNTIPAEFIRKLANGMPRRIQACIAAEGGTTKY